MTAFAVKTDRFVPLLSTRVTRIFAQYCPDVRHLLVSVRVMCAHTVLHPVEDGFEKSYPAAPTAEPVGAITAAKSTVRTRSRRDVRARAPVWRTGSGTARIYAGSGPPATGASVSRVTNTPDAWGMAVSGSMPTRLLVSAPGL